MQCSDAVRLMAVILDEGSPEQRRHDDLAPHLVSCGDCAEEWGQLQRLESLLQAQSLDRPPPHFSARATAYVLREARLTPPWQTHLLAILAVAAGVASLASAVAGLAHGFAAWLVPSLWLSLGEGLARSGISFLASLGAIVPASGQAWLLNCFMAIALATLWFAALVLPRTVPARSTARRS